MTFLSVILLVIHFYGKFVLSIKYDSFNIVVITSYDWVYLMDSEPLDEFLV